MSAYVQHPIRMMLLTMLPFKLGYWIGPFFFDSMSRKQIAVKKRDIYIDKMIVQARDGIKMGDEKTDLATILVKMSDDDGGEVLTDQQLRSHLYTFMFAGFDTSASAIHWILFFVGHHPEMVKRIAVELEKNGNQINSKTLKHVPFTVSFIKEVLRLVHVLDILIPREALVDIELPNGHIMPKGTNYAVDISAMQLSQAAWGKDALQFNPDRFNEANHHAYQNIPFSAGRRNCIGSGFAMQEMKIMLLRICSRLKVENEIVEKDADLDRPVLKQKLLWKLKPNSLNQRFTYLV